MRVLVVSDLHYTMKQFDWVVGVAADYDLVVLAGDHLDISSFVAPDAQIAVVLEYLNRIAAKTVVAASSGNHDLNASDEHDERRAKWLDQARAFGVFVDGTRFETDTEVVTICAWWDGPRSYEVVERHLADDAAVVGDRRWIWVYHTPPDGSPTSWTGKRHYGDPDLRAWIERFSPDIVVCGHVHESPYVEGGAWVDRIGSALVVNAGHYRGPTPAYIEIDTDAGTARWTSLAGVDERALTPA
jgi:Icc-related predicted phosphoesterase